MRRSFRRFRRRFKRRWDMQTFRECERQVNVEYTPETTWPCSLPLTYADYLLGMQPSAGLTMKPGATRTLTFGGAHLRLRLNTAIVNSRVAPCPHAIKFVLAIVKLPLKEDQLTPAYLPNLAISRSQLSVLTTTQSDSDEDIVWWYDGQLEMLNIACNANGDSQLCIDAFVPDSGSSGCCDPGSTPPAGTYCEMGEQAFAHAAAINGRFEVNALIRAKRRLREREALFLIQHYVLNLSNTVDFSWPVRRNAYIRYAVR